MPAPPALFLALFLLLPVSSAHAEGEVRAALALVPSAVEPGASCEARVHLVIAPGWHVNTHRPGASYLIPTTLSFELPPGVAAGPVVYPEGTERAFAFARGARLRVLTGEATLRAPLYVGAEFAGPGAVRALLRYQACSDRRCLPPRTLRLEARLRVATGTPSESGGAMVAGALPVERWRAEHGWFGVLLAVALLGLGLNLTPCVYPLVSVTVAYFGSQTRTRGSRLALATLYVLGIAVTFSALGVAAALSGSLFGSALQRPPVLIGVAALLAALAASNFGLFELRLPAPVARRLGRAGGGATGAFVMGLTLGLVAAPCIGPVVLGLLLYVGARQQVLEGLLLFFFLALGMGAPYVGLALAASSLERLPRSGAWLGWVEKLFGFVLLGLAVFFLEPLLSAAAERWLWGLLLAAAALYLGFLVRLEGGHLFTALRRVVGVAGLLAAVLTVAPRPAAGPGIRWVPFSEAALAAARARGKPVLVDVRAEWCLPCREMERTTFRDAKVVAAAKGYVALRADVTEAGAASRALMDRLGVRGVPTYILFGPDGKERNRLVGFVDAETMAAALRAGQRARRPVP